MSRVFVHAAVIVAVASSAAPAAAQSARDYRGPSPFEDMLKDQPPPKLIVDPPFREPLNFGVFQAQYRVENMSIVPIFGAEALKVVPRVGHLHVIVDDGPHWYADASDSNTVDVANLAPGPHRITIQLVDPNHNVIPGQVKTVSFTVPATAKVAEVIRQ
jgi:hypothetical protein